MAKDQLTLFFLSADKCQECFNANYNNMNFNFKIIGLAILVFLLFILHQSFYHLLDIDTINTYFPYIFIVLFFSMMIIIFNNFRLKILKDIVTSLNRKNNDLKKEYEMKIADLEKELESLYLAIENNKKVSKYNFKKHKIIDLKEQIKTISGNKLLRVFNDLSAFDLTLEEFADKYSKNDLLSIKFVGFRTINHIDLIMKSAGVNWK